MKNFSFTGNFKWSAIISVLLTITGIVGLVLLPFGVSLFNFDVDFLGGTVLRYDLHVPVDADVQNEVAELVSSVTSIAPTLQKSGDNELTIKTVDIDTEKRSAIFEALKEKYSITEADILQSDNVTATVGEDLRNAAILSASLAAILILLYITVRFEFLSGVAAVIALIHDILVMLSFYIIFQIPVNMNFIAAVLTILGYSINASIIVFDRVRENRRYMTKSEFSEVVDLSVRQTVARNINTTLTTLLPLIMIIILGVTSVRNFAIPLAIGVVAGAFSSICIGGPLWSFLRGGKKKQKI
jgi:preprotein translocase SecF subunit